MRWLRYWRLGTCLLGCISSLPVLGRTNALTSHRPNVVLIVADDLGWGDLGCYGQRNIRTPVLDRMAQEGMRFTDHYAGHTVCAPSRCALMLGLHTGHCPVRGNREVQPMGQQPIPDEAFTLAELFKQAGYTTALIGKWGLGGPGSSGEPNRQGFDYFFGYLCQRHAHNYFPEFLFRNHQRVVLRNLLAEPKRPDGAGVAIRRLDYAPDLMLKEALAFIRRNRARPFFLYFATTLPHANNEAGDRGMEIPDYGIYRDLPWPEPQKGHAAMITRLDQDVGRILDQLERLGLTDRTLVLFTSDNGPHREGGNDPEFNDSNGPFRGIKRDLYEGGIRVPLIARWPGRIPKGVVSDHVCAFWDYLPTFAELLGVALPVDVDGISFLPTLLGDPSRQRQHAFLYWEFHERPATVQAIRMGKWKAVRHSPSGPVELYDLSTDPGESRDLAGQHPEVVEKIREYLRTARTDHPLWPLREGQ